MTIEFRRPMLLLGTTLLIIQATSMPIGMVYAETTIDTEEQEIIELSPIKNHLEEEQISDPRFFFTRSKIKGTVDEPLQVTFFSDQEVSAVRVSLPEEATLLKDQLQTGISVEEGVHHNEWIVKSERAQNTFVLPLVVEKAGNYELSVEETTAHLEIGKQEDAGVGVPIEEDSSEEYSVVQEDLTEVNPSQAITEKTSATTANVSSWEQFQTAINSVDVTVINVTSNFSGNSSLNIINRDITINGNGHSINIGSQFLRHEGDNRRIVVRDISISSSGHLFQPNGYARNSQYFFSNIDTPGGETVGGSLADNLYDENISVTFDGGENTNIQLTTRVNLTVTNNSSVSMIYDQLWHPSMAEGPSSITIDEGSEVNVYGRIINLRKLSVLGSLTVVEPSGERQALGMATAGDRSLFVGRKGNLTLIGGNKNTALIDGNLVSLSFEYGSEFDLINRNSGPITNTSSNIDVMLKATNFAVWNFGRPDIEDSKPSQNFINLEAQMIGPNGSIISDSNHNVFRSTYSNQGLAGYSRINSSGIASESPLDPLNPDYEINPNNPPEISENQGIFRIDFVSQFSFGAQERVLFDDQMYYALPQYIVNEDGEINKYEPKANYVQITDNRPDVDGWQLSVTQKEQFKTTTGNELYGASLSFKNRQLISTHEGKQPRELSNDDTVNLVPGERKTLLTSSAGEGKGTWIYRFGDDGSLEQSVALFIPKTTIPQATAYKTQIDWELLSAPDNI